MRSGLAALADHPLVGEVRGEGLIAALELVDDKTTKSVRGSVGLLGNQLFAALLSNGLITRPLGDAIAICPPLILTTAESDEMLNIMARSLDEVQSTRPTG